MSNTHINPAFTPTSQTLYNTAQNPLNQRASAFNSTTTRQAMQLQHGADPHTTKGLRYDTTQLKQPTAQYCQQMHNWSIQATNQQSNQYTPLPIHPNTPMTRPHQTATPDFPHKPDSRSNMFHQQSPFSSIAPSYPDRPWTEHFGTSKAHFFPFSFQPHPNTPHSSYLPPQQEMNEPSTRSPLPKIPSSSQNSSYLITSELKETLCHIEDKINQSNGYLQNLKQALTNEVVAEQKLEATTASYLQKMVEIEKKVTMSLTYSEQKNKKILNQLHEIEQKLTRHTDTILQIKNELQEQPKTMGDMRVIFIPKSTKETQTKKLNLRVIKPNEQGASEACPAVSSQKASANVENPEEPASKRAHLTRSGDKCKKQRTKKC